MPPTTAIAPHSRLDLLDTIPQQILSWFGLSQPGNSWHHWFVFFTVVLAIWGIQRFFIGGCFRLLRHLSDRYHQVIRFRIFGALRPPTKALFVLVSLFLALRMLYFRPVLETGIHSFFRLAFPLALGWMGWNSVGALMDHWDETARGQGKNIATFIPLLRKVALALYAVTAALAFVQLFGFDVKTFLTGLGIGGLAFALAAQDTLANAFASIVVAVDQPFRVGDLIQIGTNTGFVEDIGLRSTKIRTLAKVLIVIPNRTVANEHITNLSNVRQRRVEQTISLARLGAASATLRPFLQELRDMLAKNPGIDPASVMAHFLAFDSAGIDIALVYHTRSPDYAASCGLRESVNMDILALMEKHGLALADPVLRLQADKK